MTAPSFATELLARFPGLPLHAEMFADPARREAAREAVDRDGFEVFLKRCRAAAARQAIGGLTAATRKRATDALAEMCRPELAQMLGMLLKG